MDFGLDDNQALLAETARAFFAQHKADTPDQLWRAIADLGWTGLLISEADGGVGGSLLDAILLVEQFGYAGVASPFISSAIASTVILSDAHRGDRLSQLARGETRVALAFSEETGEFTAQSVRTTVAGQSISGVKKFVRDAGVADELIVAACGEVGLNCYLVPTSQAAVMPVNTISGEDVFGITFDAVPAPTAQLLGADGAGWDVMRRGIAAGALARAAEMVGLAQRVVDIVVEYAKVREQSGQPVGAFQAIQHHCADMLRDLEGARYITYRAASTIDHAAPVDGAVAMAKAYAGDACLAVARRGHQVMGAIGYCDEHELHRLHKRIQAAAVDFGDASTHYDSIADDLGLN